jgi:CRISPR-associated Csx3 family protein
MDIDLINIDLSSFYTNTAKLSDLNAYIQKALDLAGEGNEVVLTGRAPVWLYLKIVHALHGKARRLIYRSPVTGDVVIFDHDPFKDA